jgi:altronate hydrolase
MKNNAIKIHKNDNVVIATRDIRKDEAVISEEKQIFLAVEGVLSGHKIALNEIKAGENVIRYGEPIVKAIVKIEPGQWIHTHNTQPIT